mmetsp:Transcript_46407/g.110560  ORF Transcript_46407/g.110560 Transcript_46407/m.110560 type:complete len:634 (-) Transcript_46407:113-2014(-)
MDGGGGDLSLLIRRARRAGAKRVDLSNRGLRHWPEDLFTLTQLQNIDASGNDLTSVGSSFAQLTSLEELDLSNNKVSSLEDISLDALPRLLAINLEGNPVASQIELATRRQLADPVHGSGAERPTQVLRRLLNGGGYIPSAVAARGLETQTSFNSGGGAAGTASSLTPLRPPSAKFTAQTAAPDPAAAAAAESDLDRILTFNGDSQPAWRKEQKVMLQEMETLRERIKELEEKQGVSGGGSQSSSFREDLSKPSWLRGGPAARDLSATLPSRQGNMSDSNEAAELKTQLREEQRKNKRLEQEVQRLSERLNESRASQGGAAGGSVPHFDLSEVDVQEQISQGGFSVIHKGVWHCTTVAVKKLFDPNINEELLAEFDNEVQKLGQLRHPNILALLAVHRKPPALSLIMELVEGGSLFQLLHSPHQFQGRVPAAAGGSNGGVPLKETLRILDTTGVVLAFLHARGIVHRDVKTHNVLLTPTLEVKVCDFGLARMRSELMTGTMQFAGTPNYMAPEIFKNQKYTERVDVFAYGTLMWETMAVDIPFANLDPQDIKERVLAGKMLPMPAAAPPALQEAIEACWTIDQARRPGMAEVLVRVREAGKADAMSVRARRPRTATGARDISGPVGMSRTGLM